MLKLPEGIHWKTANQTMPIGPTPPPVEGSDLYGGPWMMEKNPWKKRPLLCSYTISYDYKVVILPIFDVVILYVVLSQEITVQADALKFGLLCYCNVCYYVMSMSCDYFWWDPKK